MRNFVEGILKILLLKLSTGGSQKLPIKSEKWSGSSGGSCENGVHVKCIKNSGKYFNRIRC